MSAGQEGVGADQGTLAPRLLELSEVQHWVYHVGDLATGALTTTELDGPLTRQTRAKALSQFGSPVGVTLGGPSYRLTPRAPYQASPEASMLAAFPNSFDSGNDVIGWDFPPGAGRLAGAVVWSFAVAPEANVALISVSLSAAAFPGLVGQVVVAVEDDSNLGTIKVPITGSSASHIIDLAFVPFAGRSMAVGMNFEPGIDLLTFSEISLGPIPPSSDPVASEPLEPI